MTSAASTPEQTVQPAPTSRPRDKVRLRFSKTADLRLVSHHDLMKCFERILRRAGLPLQRTQGFHPLPRMVFAQALALGIVGLEEVIELEFTETIEPEEVRQRVAAQMPPGLQVLSARRIPVRQSAQPRRAGYRVGVPAERAGAAAMSIAALLAAEHCWIERQRPSPRQIDLRPLVSEVRLVEAGPGAEHSGTGNNIGFVLELVLWITPQGSARPEEVLRALSLGELIDEGALIERYLLEIVDEVPDAGPLPAALHTAPASRGAGAEPASGPTALISGPMNYES
jgi:radical SAM-linked protein